MELYTNINYVTIQYDKTYVLCYYNYTPSDITIYLSSKLLETKPKFVDILIDSITDLIHNYNPDLIDKITITNNKQIIISFPNIMSLILNDDLCLFDIIQMYINQLFKKKL